LLNKSDIEALEGDAFGRWQFSRERGCANQNAEKDAATAEQIFGTEKLQDEGVHFFETFPERNGYGMNIRGEVVNGVFGPNDQHRTFLMNGLPGIVLATDRVLEQTPQLDGTFKAVMERITGQEGTTEFPTPVCDRKDLPNHRKGRTTVFLVKQFAQLVLGPNASEIFESFVEAPVANTRKGRKRKAPEVDPGSKLRKECKSSEWKLFYEKWMTSDGLEAVLKAEVTLGYYLARVPVPFCRRCLFLYEIFLKPLQTGTGFYAF